MAAPSRVRRVRWRANATALLVVDMWNCHACAENAARNDAMARSMNRTVAAFRALGGRVVWAVHGCSRFAPMATSAARRNRKALGRDAAPPMPAAAWLASPLGRADWAARFPVTTDGTCATVDAGCQHSTPAVWARRCPHHHALTMDDADYAIADRQLCKAELARRNRAGCSTLWSVVRRLGIEHVLYVGSALNMCFFNRNYGIRSLLSWGAVAPRDVAFVRDLTDIVKHVDDDRPKGLSHFESLKTLTRYVEDEVVPSVSAVDIVRSAYLGAE